MVSGCVALFVVITNVNAIAILIAGFAILTWGFFGNTGDCGGGEVLGRFVAGGNMVSISGCRGGWFPFSGVSRS